VQAGTVKTAGAIHMKIIVAVLVIASSGAVSLTTFSGSASALCNEICRAKCEASWRKYFKSARQCRDVWSLRNGRSGYGCGLRGMYVPCKY
jgi:hypothetical protein